MAPGPAGPAPVESILFIEPFGQFPQNDNLVLLFQHLIDKVMPGRYFWD
jgi:hypothetical protein